MSNKKLIVIFPGRNYSTDCPLLYYASFKYEVLGYEEVAISYGDLINESNTIEDCIEGIKSMVLLRLQAINL